MPDTDSPKVPMSDEEFPSTLFAKETSQGSARLHWFCPGEDAIAAYLDGTHDSKARFEFHLTKCERCRRMLADVVKTVRDEDLVPPPLDIVQRALQLAPENRRRADWAWVPVGAAAVLALVIASVVVLKHEPLIVSTPSAPSAPLIAKSSPTSIPEALPNETVRKPPSAELLLPRVIFPKPDSVVPIAQLKFDWMRVSNAQSYEIRIVASDGDLVWEGQTEASSFHLPAGVALKDGSYFVWVMAYMHDGRTLKSSPVSFLIKR